MRIGLATARGLALALDLPAAGVSTLDALAAGAPGALPVIDARRREVFVPGPLALAAADLELEPGTVCVGDGARRYRDVLEGRAPRCRRTTTSATCRAPASTPRSRPTSARPRRSSRSTSACRTPTGASRRDASSSARSQLRDLSAIETIERVSYPTPWSRSMFAGELAKPSSICLGAFEAEGELVGYLIISRYVDAWHVMNIAVAPDWRRRGIATHAARAALRADGERRAPRLHARGARLEHGRDPALRAARLPRPRGSGAATTRTTARTR